MSDHDETPAAPRPGSAADLSRRMDRQEQRTDELATQLARVEQTLAHTEELNRLRFEGMSRTIDTLAVKFDAFTSKFDQYIMGTLDTPDRREGARILADYYEWRRVVDQALAAKDDVHLAEDARREERRRIVGLSNKALGVLVVVVNFILGAVVVITSLAGSGSQ